MIRVLLFLVVLVLAAAPASLAQGFTGFDDFLKRYEAAEPVSRPELVRSFVEWQRGRGGFPIVQGNGGAVFFYLGTGAEQEVRVVGDFHPRSFFNLYWDKAGQPLTRSGAVFYQCYPFEPDARLDYQFVVDGKAVNDPLNPRTIFSGVGGGEVSELVMPGHVFPPELSPRPEVPKGTVQVLDLPWANPKVRIYLPPGYDPAKSYPALYTADGSAWVDLIRLPVILDNLIADRAVRPVIAVMIDAAEDRSVWYYFNRGYLDYLQRIVEHVDRHFATVKGPEGRVHAGSSAGGRITLFTGLERPGLFRKLALLSPELSGPAHYWKPWFSGERRPDPGLDVWLSAGTYEGSMHRDAQAMEAYLRKSGARTRSLYVHQGHSFGAWRETAVEMLKHFFG